MLQFVAFKFYKPVKNLISSYERYQNKKHPTLIIILQITRSTETWPYIRWLCRFQVTSSQLVSSFYLVFHQVISPSVLVSLLLSTLQSCVGRKQEMVSAFSLHSHYFCLTLTAWVETWFDLDYDTELQYSHYYYSRFLFFCVIIIVAVVVNITFIIILS